MRLKHTSLRLAGAALIAVAVVPWLGGSPASAAPASYNATIKAAQVPTTAANFGDRKTDCPDWAVGDPQDSFHFVTDGQRDFVSLTVEFSTGTVTTTSFGPPTAKHAYVEAPAGATLVNAWATLDPAPTAGTPAADFQLSHVCVGKPGTTSSSPPASSSSPPVSSSSPPVSSSSAPPSSSSAPVTSATSAPPASSATSSESVSVLPTKIENTSAAATASPKTSVLANELPHTGGGVPYPALVVLSLGLLLVGGSLILLPGLSVDRPNRRH